MLNVSLPHGLDTAVRYRSSRGSTVCLRAANFLPPSPILSSTDLEHKRTRKKVPSSCSTLWYLLYLSLCLSVLVSFYPPSLSILRTLSLSLSLSGSRWSGGAVYWPGYLSIIKTIRSYRLSRTGAVVFSALSINVLIDFGPLPGGRPSPSAWLAFDPLQRTILASPLLPALASSIFIFTF